MYIWSYKNNFFQVQIISDIACRWRILKTSLKKVLDWRERFLLSWWSKMKNSNEIINYMNIAETWRRVFEKKMKCGEMAHVWNKLFKKALTFRSKRARKKVNFRLNKKNSSPGASYFDKKFTVKKLWQSIQ